MYKVRFKLLDLKNIKQAYNVDLSRNTLDTTSINNDLEVIINYKLKLKKFLKNKIFYILGFIYFISFLLLNNYKIDDIIFSNNYIENKEILTDINSNIKNILGYKKIYNLESLTKYLRLKYNEFEWINLYILGNDLYVEVKKWENVNEKTLEIGDIIAKKNGVIKSFYVKNGVSNLYINKYVSKGDILISGENKYHASGKVLAEVSYYEEIKIKKEINYKKYYKYSEEVSFFNNYFIFNKNKTNCDIIIIDSFKFLKINKIAKKYYNLINIKLDYKLALENSNEIINNKFEDILELKLLSNSNTENEYVFKYYVKVLEDISLFRS